MNPPPARLRFVSVLETGMFSRGVISLALAVFWSSAALPQGSTFSAEKFYRDLEPETRAHYKDAWDAAAVESKRRAAAGLPHITDSDKGIAEKGIKSLIYNTAVRKTLCFEQALERRKDYETALQIAKSCLEQTSNEIIKFSKISDYANTIPRAKSARCEMKSRDYKNEIRFPPFDFLRDARELAPHLFDYKMFNDCLLSDRD